MSSDSDATTRGTAEDPGGCHYVADRLVVRREDLQTAIDELSRGGFQPEDATDATLRDYLGDYQDPDGLPLGAIGLPENPHRGAAYLAQIHRPIEAAPIHGVGYEGHRGFMSGEGPGPADDLQEPDKSEIEKWVAVIDSGITDEGLRSWWMSSDYVDWEPIDIEQVEKGDASHGTFVSSVIRKVAPDHGIAFAAARPDKRLESRHGSEPVDPPTHELEVLGAVLRLVRRFGDEPWRIAALNLSLGAARCGENDGFLLSLRIALEIWHRHFGYDSPVFAAGGNGPSPRAVYPGAFDWVRSVAAADESGNQVVWRNGVIEPAMPRPWISDVAPGVKVHGLSGASERETVWWSGSSFATAIATSLSVTGETFDVDQADTYWQSLPMVYADVDGLEHG